MCNLGSPLTLITAVRHYFNPWQRIILCLYNGLLGPGPLLAKISSTMALNHFMRSMQPESAVLGYAAVAEAVMLLLLTLPGLESLRVGLVMAVRSILKPLLLLVPLCLFLLVQLCWWCMSSPPGFSEHGCTYSDNLRHGKSLVESNLDAILIATALLLYWLLFSITNLLLRVHQLGQQLETLKKSD